jgi:hypothetical protein
VASLPQQPSSVEKQSSPLQSTAYVYVRAPLAAKGLSPLYRGPYQVIKRTPKYFTIAGGASSPRAASEGRCQQYCLIPGQHWGGGGGSVEDRGVE